MQNRSRLIAWVLFSSLAPSWVLAAEKSGPHPMESWKDSVREFLRGQGEGSLANPIALRDAPAVAKLCDTLQDPARAHIEGDAYSRGKARHDRMSERRQAQRSVYSVTIGPKAFDVREYQYKKWRLPLELSKALVAFNGALVLQIMDREGGSFKLAPEEASGMAKKLQKKAVGLKVVFLVEDDAFGPSCFIYPKSDVYTLRVQPLSYELIEEQTGASLARTRTPALERFRAWLDPGKPRLNIRVVRTEGTLPEAEMNATIEAKKAELATCLEKIMKSQTHTLIAAIGADVLPSGSLDNVRVDIGDERHRDAVQCLKKRVAESKLPKGKESSGIQVLVAVERGLEEHSELMTE